MLQKDSVCDFELLNKVFEKLFVVFYFMFQTHASNDHDETSYLVTGKYYVVGWLVFITARNICRCDSVSAFRHCRLNKARSRITEFNSNLARTKYKFAKSTSRFAESILDPLNPNHPLNHFDPNYSFQSMISIKLFTF